MMDIFSKSCHFCKKKIKGKPITRKVKVPGYYGLNKKHFCTKEHFELYQKFIKKYEKHRKIPENSGCVACVGKTKKI